MTPLATRGTRRASNMVKLHHVPTVSAANGRFGRRLLAVPRGLPLASAAGGWNFFVT
jgi:hypothetical protein